MVCWFTISVSGIVTEGGSSYPSLGELREACEAGHSKIDGRGGTVELLTLESHNQMWISEVSRLLKFPVNQAATALYWDANFRSTSFMSTDLRGPVVMVYTGRDVDYQDCYDHIMQYDNSMDYQDYTKIQEEE